MVFASASSAALSSDATLTGSGSSRAAKFVGRVGALAVALGVGSAVVAAPWASADTTDAAGADAADGPSTSAPEAVSGAPAGSRAGRRGSAATVGASAESDGGDPVVAPRSGARRSGSVAGSGQAPTNGHRVPASGVSGSASVPASADVTVSVRVPDVASAVAGSDDSVIA